MSSPDLRRSWKITRTHLEAAQAALPGDLVRECEDGSMARYSEYLEHNELELACEELEALGFENCAGRAFWSELLHAATNMGLSDRAERYRCQRDTLSA